MMEQQIASTTEYILAVLQLFVLLRLFNMIFGKIIKQSKNMIYPQIERRKSLLKDLFLSVFYNAVFMISKSFLISLMSGFVLSEIVVGIGEKLNTSNENK